MKVISFLGACALALTSTPALSAPELALKFPGTAETTADQSTGMATFRLTIGPFAAGKLPEKLAEGRLDQTAWRIDGAQISTLQLMQSLRDQITAAGFQLIYECETEACGGFDFRFATNVLAEPDMHVDLGDFRYLAAQRPGKATSEFLALMVSRSQHSSFVQLSRVGGSEPLLPAAGLKDVAPAGALQQTDFAQAPAPQVDLTEIGKDLDQGLPLVLEDLIFGSGSADLQAGDYASLTRLADWLRANPTKTVILVGHTDASGGLAANVALSKKRAESVRQALRVKYAVPSAQIGADGVGPLSPRASNLDAEGRRKNRRVEVVITPTQ